MEIVTAAQMRELDQTTIKQYHLPGSVLMENAGLRVVEWIWLLLGGWTAGQRVLVFVGKGNNGGDGLVVARHLLNAGVEVKVFCLGRLADFKGEARSNLLAYQQMEGRLYWVQEERDIQRVQVAMLYADLVVDALYGTGLRGAVTGLGAKLIETINATRRPVVAIDIPSGLDSDNGMVCGPCIQAGSTVTFCRPKWGLLGYPGSRYTGKLVVADISIPEALVRQQTLTSHLLTYQWARQVFPRRSADAHKGAFGHVLVLGGSTGMAGAVALAARAALRSGAGLVTMGLPRSLVAQVSGTAEAMTMPLPEAGEGILGQEALNIVQAALPQYSALVLGPGLGRQPATIAMVRELLPRVTVPLVIDADALNALAGQADLLAQLPASLVITPHPGEMARLLGVTVNTIQQNRLKVATEAAQRWRSVIVLKGAGTVVADPQGRVGLNLTGNPGMATGGAGDVLAGVIAALLAQGLDPWVAASLGVLVHGAAGDRAAGRQGQLGLSAGDIVEGLPQCWQQLERNQDQVQRLPGLWPVAVWPEEA